MAQQKTKVCIECRKRLSIKQFHKDKSQSDGLLSRCKQCAKAKQEIYRPRNPRPNSLAPKGTKWCPKCRQYKQKDSFHKNLREKDGLRGECKTCCEKKEKTRDYYEKEYGISRSIVESIFIQQNQKCAVCKTLLSTLGEGRLDHCHKTGQIRGILCHNCNVALGHLKDDPVRISALLAYLCRDGLDD